ncbi:asparaginase [Halorientalis salina]|uniref:asparaginase n=1 Tax=Halorientalis salina TaxID=2932266 RepID=UPI002022B172|nr:asparaginase [Halorientalis salina]
MNYAETTNTTYTYLICCVMPNIRILSTGGTIASTDGTEGARPEKDGAEILGDAAEAREYASISVEEVAQIPSFDMGFETMATIVRSAHAAVKDGIDGVVVTHGTDTMEESAFYADQTSTTAVPIVFTGAQRRPDEPSPDGPANLIGAVRAAAHDRIQAAGGTYIAFDDQLHEADAATKAHTSRVGAFNSPGSGPIASLDRDRIRFHHEPDSTEQKFDPVVPTSSVRVIPSGVNVPSDPIDEAIEVGVDGLVVQGTGLGNTTDALGHGIANAIDHGIPVVVGSRCPGGATMPVYGGDGGGETLREYGVGFADNLPVQKARIKLALALSTTDEPLEWFRR